MNIHELKTWPQYFQAIMEGAKTFEVRKNDRAFAVGDTLHLREWNPHTGQYTERSTLVQVLYIMPGDIALGGIREGYCVMSIAPVPMRPMQFPHLEEVIPM